MTKPTQSEIDNTTQVELEELSEVVDLPVFPERLAPGTLLEGPNGTLQVDAFLDRKAAINLYAATFQDDRKVWLREAGNGAGAERLRHESAVLGPLKSPMFSPIVWRPLIFMPGMGV